MTLSLTYAAITPACNEAENLRRLAACLLVQSVRPAAWIVVDDGSTDATPDVARAVTRSHPWARVVALPRPSAPAPSGRLTGRDVAAFSTGLDALRVTPDVVVKLDADVSFDTDYLERLVGAFAAEPELGIASGLCFELEEGDWRPQHVTGAHARGATRAYRRECLEDVLPLERHIGWDGVDEVKASLRGWRTGTLPYLRFFHHRRLAERDGRRRGWAIQGLASYYMGYRPSYLLLRALHRARRDPAALAMVTAYARASARRDPRCPDPEVGREVRRVQRLRSLMTRAREATGRSPATPLAGAGPRRA